MTELQQWILAQKTPELSYFFIGDPFKNSWVNSARLTSLREFNLIVFVNKCCPYK